MANKKISELPAAGALTGAELVPLVQSAVTSRTTMQAILNLVSANLTPSPTSISSTISRIVPSFGRTVAGFTVSNSVAVYGGFQDGASLGTSYSFAAPAGATELLRSGRRTANTFSTGGGGGGATSSPYYQTTAYDNYRRLSGHNYTADGMYVSCRFGYEHAAVNWPRFFMGLTQNQVSLAIGANTGAFNILQNLIGVGKDDLDTNIQVITNDGAGSITKTDTGINYQSAINHLLQMSLFSAWDQDLVRVELLDVETGVLFGVNLTTNLPAADTNIGFHYTLSEGFHNSGAGIQLGASIRDGIISLPH